MAKLNCWEHKRCGKGLNEAKACGKEICPAATEEKFDRMNFGKNGGRLCWLIKRELSAGKDKGAAITLCCRCDFFKLVEEEEGANFFVYP